MTIYKIGLTKQSFHYTMWNSDSTILKTPILPLSIFNLSSPKKGAKKYYIQIKNYLTIFCKRNTFTTNNLIVKAI